MSMCMVLRHSLTQKLALRLTQIHELGTSGNKEAEEQATYLKKFLDEARDGTYAGWEDFHDRCMKRIKKEERSPSVKELVRLVRDGVSALAPEREGLILFLEYGLAAYERSQNSPSLAYEKFTPAIRARESQETKRMLLTEITQGSTRFPDDRYESLLLTIAADPLLGDAHVQESMGRIGALTPKIVAKLESDLYENIPATHREDQFDLALETLIAFEELMPDFYDTRSPSCFRAFIKRDDAKALAESHPHIPLPLLGLLAKLEPSPEALEKVEAFCADARVANGRDVKRHLISGVNQLTLATLGKGIFDHALRVSTTAQEFERLLEEVGVHLKMSGGHLYSYNQEATTFTEFYNGLRRVRLASSLARIPLSEGYQDKLIERSDQIPQQFIRIISTLSDIYQRKHPQGLPLLARLTEHVLDQDFTSWRYGHEKAAAQLLKAAESTAWSQNTVQRTVLKVPDGLEQKLQAFHALKGRVTALYIEEHGEEPSPERNRILEESILSLEQKLREAQGDKRDLSKQVSDLRVQYQHARLLEFFDFHPESAEATRSLLAGYLRSAKHAAFHDVISQAMAVLNEPEMRNLKTVLVEETDHYLDLLNIGLDPVQSCQRWTEETGYNHCLLAYVLDANKKAFYLKDKGKNIASAVVRILPFKESLALLVERPYYTQWTGDHANALLTAVLQKAGNLAEELGLPIAVGYTDRRGEYQDYFKEVAKTADLRISHSKLSLHLPESMNAFEYSDALGGLLKSGSTVTTEFHYLMVEPE